MPTLPDTVIAALVAIAGAVLGYAFREYRNRVTPLFEIISIWTTSKRSEKVQVDTNIVHHLRGSFYPQEIQPEASLGTIYDTWDRCDDLSQIWPDLKKSLAATITAASDDEFLLELADFLNQRFFEGWLIKLLLNGRVDFLITPEVLSAPERIHTWLEEEDDHQIWFDLPPAGKAFGRSMHHPAIYGKCEPFILAISRLHRPGIENAFHEFIRIFDADYNKAMACVQDLKRIDNKNERWVFRCFVANTSSTPFVIENRGIAAIVDTKTKTKYIEPCYLAMLNEDNDLVDTNLPLVVPSGEGQGFALLTERVQKAMDLGRELRSLFERGDGNCYLSVVLRRPGVLRRQTYRSAKISFMQPKKGAK